jgi:membrane protein YqaA with SNARE-associated domain
MSLSGVEQVVIVVAGAALTLLLGGALLYWIDREWRKLDARHRRGDTTPNGGPAENRAEPPSEPPPAN